MRLGGEHVLTIEADLGPVVELGRVATGVRRVIPIVGGTVRGAADRALDGEVLPGGADWNLTRDDGSVELWARYEIRLAGGAFVSVLNTAVHATGAEPPLLTQPRFEVGEGGPDLLRTGAFVGLLEPPTTAPRVRIEVHRVLALP